MEKENVVNELEDMISKYNYRIKKSKNQFFYLVIEEIKTLNDKMYKYVHENEDIKTFKKIKDNLTYEIDKLVAQKEAIKEAILRIDLL